MSFNNHDNQDPNAVKYVKTEKPKDTIKVPTVKNSVIEVCKLADNTCRNISNIFPFIEDITLTKGDLIILGVDIQNISNFVFELQEHRITDTIWIKDKLMYSGFNNLGFDFCFQFGPYIFVVCKRIRPRW